MSLTRVAVIRATAGAMLAIALGACQGAPPRSDALSPSHRAALEDTLRTFANTLLAAENALNADRVAVVSDGDEAALSAVGQDEYEMSRTRFGAVSRQRTPQSIATFNRSRR